MCLLITLNTPNWMGKGTVYIFKIKINAFSFQGNCLYFGGVKCFI